jgi:hypothetical protein
VNAVKFSARVRLCGRFLDAPASPRGENTPSIIDRCLPYPCGRPSPTPTPRSDLPAPTVQIGFQNKLAVLHNDKLGRQARHLIVQMRNAFLNRATHRVPVPLALACVFSGAGRCSASRLDFRPRRARSMGPAHTSCSDLHSIGIRPHLADFHCPAEPGGLVPSRPDTTSMDCPYRVYRRRRLFGALHRRGIR